MRNFLITWFIINIIISLMLMIAAAGIKGISESPAAIHKIINCQCYADSNATTFELYAELVSDGELTNEECHQIEQSYRQWLLNK